MNPGTPVQGRTVREYYWDADGMAEIARLVDALVTPQRAKGGRITKPAVMTQNVLAKTIGVSPSTIMNLRRNIEGTVVNDPHGGTLEKLAPYLINPRTGRPFTGVEIMALATGVYDAPTLAEYVNSYLDRKGHDMGWLAEACGVPLKSLAAVVDDPAVVKDKEERLKWIITLGGKIGNPFEISRLMGVKVNLCAA